MWLYNGAEFTEDTTPYVGFVYRITNLIDNKQYIGKKFFTKAGVKQVKGKKKKIRKPSDWSTYFGSNKKLLEDVAVLGEEHFIREILRLCTTKGQCSYFEAKYQFLHEVLEHPTQWYNQQIMCRINQTHLKL